MDIKSFVAETLVQIQEGVQMAIDRRMASDSNTGAINQQFEPFDSTMDELVERVQFDIAVTAESKNEAKGGGGIKVLSVGLEAEGKKSQQNSVVSRISFAVRLVPPVTRIRTDLASNSRVVRAGERKNQKPSDSV